MKMKVRDLLGMEIDVDVWDDYDEGIGIAFVGPQELTADGENFFKDALDVDCEFTVDNNFGDSVLLLVNDMDEKKRSEVLPVLKTLFYGAAGYIQSSLYDRFFKEEVY